MRLKLTIHACIGMGLPFSTWNVHVLKIIGERCGGLIDVDRSTRE